MNSPAMPQLPAWLAALLIAFALSASHLLNGAEDHSTEAAQAQALEAEHRQADAEQADLRHTQAVCGPNTGWVQLKNGARACTDKRGRLTGQLLAEGTP